MSENLGGLYNFIFIFILFSSSKTKRCFNKTQVKKHKTGANGYGAELKKAG
jgi:hypothetical protein